MTRVAAFYLVAIFVCATPRPVFGQECGPPAAAAVADAAVRAAGIDDQIGQRWTRRIRSAALLPDTARVEVRGVDDDVFRIESRFDQDFDDNLDADGADVTDVQRSGVDRLREIRIVVAWRLSELEWSPDQLAVARLERDLRAERARLVDAVLTLFFDWQRACATDANGGEISSETRELEARLGVLTAGWFTEMIAPTRWCPSPCARIAQ